MIKQSDAILVKRSPGKGRGVFARRPIKKGEVFETAPILLFPAKSLVDGLENPWIGNYYFWWDKKTIVIALGYGSLYNHSSNPNSKFTFGARSISFRATRDIAKGEELTINYKYDEEVMKLYNFQE